MKAARRFLGLCLIITMGLMMSSCIKMKQLLVIYPDGSGKLLLTIGMNKQMAEMAKAGGGGGEAEGLDLKPTKVIEKSVGIVAWTDAEEYTEGDFTFFKMTGYFEDINEVQTEKGSFTFKRLDDGSYEYTFVDKELTEEEEAEGEGEGKAEGEGEGEGVGEEGPGDEMEKEMARSMMKMILQGFEASYEVKMPGEVTAAEGMEFEGRDARLVIDDDKMIDLKEKPEEAAKGISGKVISKAEEDLSEEIAAFKKEMEEAKAAWEKKKAEEEAKKAAGGEEEKPAEAEEGERKETGEEKKEEGGGDEE